MKIAEVVPQNDYILHIKTEEGQTGLFDVTPYLESEMFTPLKIKSEFNRVHNGTYFIEWDCGADLSADTIQARWKPLIPPHISQDLAADGTKTPSR